MLRPPKITLTGKNPRNFKIEPDTLIIVRGLKLTDNDRTRIEYPGYDHEIVLIDLPYDGTELHLHFGADGTYQTVVAQDPKKLMWGPQNSFVSEGQIFNTGDFEFYFTSDCGDESKDASITAVIGFYPGKRQLSISYSIDQE